MKNRRRILSRYLYLFSLLSCLQISAFDVAAWVATSSRVQNPIILDLIMTGSSATSQQILEALAQRDDLYCEDIIERVFHQETADRELLLESYLTQITEAGEMRIVMWIDANPGISDLMIRNMSSFSSPYLKTCILRLIPYARRVDSKSYLMREAVDTLMEIENQGGYVGSGRFRELLELLRIISDFRDPDFLEICLSISESSRQAMIVSKSREVTLKLISTE